ncbi:MAG: hypothetical protein D6766_13975 [Verrucomicrobia bacterium]|nr:MAG: hypothetical protein D6766_13975 [Verrucomicrobiota bacterium]
MSGIPVTLLGRGHPATLLAAALARAGHTVRCLNTDVPEGDADSATSPLQPPEWDPALGALWEEQAAVGRLGPWQETGAPPVALWIETPQAGPAEAEMVWQRRFHRFAGVLRRVRLLILVEFGPAPALPAAARALRSALWNQREPYLALLPLALPARSALETLRHPPLWILTSLGPRRGLEECRPVFESFGSPIMMTDPPAAGVLQATRHALPWFQQVAVTTFPAGAVENARLLRDYRRGLEAGEHLTPRPPAPGLGLGGLLESRPALLAELPLAVVRGNGLIQAARRAHVAFLERVFAFLADHLRAAANPRVAVWGVTTEPHTDQLVESPTLELVRKLLGIGVQVRVHDPSLEADPLRLPWVDVARTPEEAAQGADALILGADWPVYGRLDPAELRRHVRRPLLVDGRGFFDPDEMRSAGWEHHDAATLF